MNPEKIDIFFVKVCEKAHPPITFFKKDGCCQKPNIECKYNRSNLGPVKLCNKDTTTPIFFNEILI